MGHILGDAFPYVAGAFKIIVLCIGGYFAIKWHFEEDRRVREAKGEVFDKVSYMKKLAIIITSLISLVLLIVLVVYATNWYLD
ncbi:hypothetical protein [Vibrio palustris]|uniref:Uncharacterized protein n=1 Tax=Vibrio palustris TaxID=1918946 RepID=A0A1R4B1F8_9VIBR|nr:hypothetical protein [Vibrio palustris]SJL82755.1 hypothetical protein VPAL9027_00692 [Vibrio palustris]